jgi:hypothetical protein
VDDREFRIKTTSDLRLASHTDTWDECLRMQRNMNQMTDITIAILPRKLTLLTPKQTFLGASLLEDDP